LDYESSIESLGYLYLLEIGAFARYDCVDAIAGALSKVGELILDRFRAVAIPTQVGEENLAPRRFANRLKQVPSRPIGKVSVTPTYPLFQ